MAEEKALRIAEQAASLSFERCGIVGMERMREYGEKLAARIERFPEAAGMYGRFFAFADPRQAFPWARSVVACSWRYGVYRVPEEFDGLVGKSYLFDERRNAESDGFRARTALEQYMKEELGLRVASSHDYGITSCRWAALSAGLGVIRRNNFFYGDHGSYYALIVFLVNEEMEHVHVPQSRPCSDNCNLCVKHCPTGALAEPYATCGPACVSFLTNKTRSEALFGKYASKLGSWVYGCDVCQDVCPFNRGKLSGEEEFPGIKELAAAFSLEKILTMDDAYLRDVVAPKFWYIEAENVWMWKRNALNALSNARQTAL
jgi:epoxyqueuosine reductase